MTFNLKLDHVLPDLDAALYEEEESVTLCQRDKPSSTETLPKPVREIQSSKTKSHHVASKRTGSVPCLVLAWPWGVETLSKNMIIGRDKSFSSLATQLKPYMGISRLHAQIRLMHGSFCLYDLHSTNGTYVGEKRVHPDEPVHLQRGDQVRFAHELMVTVEEIEDN